MHAQESRVQLGAGRGKKNVLLSFPWIPWIAITVGQRELNTALLLDPEVEVFGSICVSPLN
jgi:hypothetical protein